MELPSDGIPVIKGLSHLTHEIWHLTVVGSLTTDVGEIKKLIAQRNLSRQIEIAGPKNGNELVKLFLQSHVFVMPYSHEGFGMAYLKATAFAMSVVEYSRS